MPNSFITDVKEMSRGVNWVKFLVKFRKIVSSESGSETAIRLHEIWFNGEKGPRNFRYGTARVQRFNFDDDKAVFTFKTEPYSMKSNDYFMYIFNFGKWVDERLMAIAAQAKSKEPMLNIFNPDWLQKYFTAIIPTVDSSGLTIDKNPPPLIEKKPIVEINSEMKVKSFISRFINK